MTKDGKDNPSPPLPPPSGHPNYHPVLSVSNIKNDIPLILDREKVHYSNLDELFDIHCHECDVLDHIDSTKPRPFDISYALESLTFVVKKWIFWHYFTKSPPNYVVSWL